MKFYLKIVAIMAIIAIIGASSYEVYSYYGPGYRNVNTGKIQFVQSGLMTGTNWTIKVTGVDYTEQETSNSTEMNFSSLENGVYSYIITSETGYSLQQSGQTNASGYTGVVDVGDVHTSQGSGYNTYPLDVVISLNFTMLTPSIEIASTGSSSSPYDYLINILSVTWSIKMSYVNFTVVNTNGQKYTLPLYTALNKAQPLGGIWNVNASGSQYLSEGTSINVYEIAGTTGDAAVMYFVFVDTLTGGTMGEV